MLVRSRFLSDRWILPARLVSVLILLALTVQLTRAATFNPGCSVGNAAALQTAITTAGSNGEADTINLASACTYVITTSLIVNADSGHLLTINGNGAIIDGSGSHQVFQILAGANVVMDDVTITDGFIDILSGGGIWLGGTLTLTDSTVRDSHADGFGGGIFVATGGSLTLENSAVNRNNANAGGGIAVFIGGTASITGSRINENGGSGIGNAGNTSLTDSTVRGNLLGAGIENGGVLNVTDSSIRDHSFGLLMGDGLATVTNSTLSNNGIRIDGGTMTLNNSTVVMGFEGNNLLMYSGQVSLYNTILAGSSAENCHMEGGGLTSTFSLVEDGSCGVTNGVNGNKTGDPSVGALTGNPAYYPLSENSPAIDAGSDALIPAGVTTDQPGNPRIQGGRVDMGAVEYQCPTFPYAVPASSTILLKFAIECANDAPTNDVINLTNSVYVLSEVDNSGGGVGANGLPAIRSTATSGTLTINGNGAAIFRGVDAPAFRIVFVLGGGNLTLNRVMIVNGSNDNGGGGIRNNGTIRLESSNVTTNFSSGDGGGIRNALAGTMTLINTTVNGNYTDGEGGGIFNRGTLTLHNTTVAKNGALVIGGISTDGTTTLNNSIVADNSGGNCTGVMTVSFSLIEDGSCGIVNGVDGNKTGDPSLGTQTGSPNYLPLLPRSIAINAGSNALVPVGVTTDQAGNTRIQDTTVDMGAFETTPATSLVTLQLQGRPGGGSPTKEITVHVQVRATGSTTPLFSQDFTSNTNGRFIIPNLVAGTYDLWIKGSHTLAVLHPVTFVGGSNPVTTSLLLEGDADDSNTIILTDFSLLANVFNTAVGNPNYEAYADFNNDGVVNLIDFSLLASNYAQAGAP